MGHAIRRQVRYEFRWQVRFGFRCARTLAAPTAVVLSATSATPATSAKVAGAGSRGAVLPGADAAPSSSPSSAALPASADCPSAATSASEPLRGRAVRHRTIGRDCFIQVLVLLFQIHEIGNVQKGVAFQPNIDKGRLHAWQHARYSALINRAC